MWSPAKIRVACLVLLGAALPAAATFTLPAIFVKWLCLAWLAGVALLLHRLSRRVAAETEVLAVNERGILDRRLMARPITWQEIAAISPVDTGRNHVIDISLRWPRETLAETSWPVRLGAYCQLAYGVPAISISMLLLDGNVGEMLDAIAQHRPDLLRGIDR